MDNDELEKWKRAGSLASRAREYGKGEIEEGVEKLELVEAVENFIRKNSNEKRFHFTRKFPANLSQENGMMMSEFFQEPFVKAKQIVF